ncbi:MAG TPA: twin-arginine translocase subunit TatC [Actinomycetota bacterium]|jgi:sec-independent protein translocase protein TatC|nr:twin-arginine translocase subunit TatC [Actinomycetota bacterium]
MAEAHNLRRRRLRFLRRRRQRKVDAAMTVVEHLSELRTRLIVSLGAFAAISVAAFFFYEPLLELLTRPLCSLPRARLGPQGCRLVFTQPLEAFFFRLKMTALAGVAVSSPVWLYEVYAFVLPALTPKEKRYASPFLACSIALFAAGTAVAYLTLSRGLGFLIGLGGEGLVPLLAAEAYLNFVGLMLLGFGVTFELPLLLIFLGLAGAVSVDSLRRQRKAAFVGIFVIAAVVTPSQDPYTMSVLALPLYGLYEVTIVVLARLLRRRTAS